MNQNGMEQGSCVYLSTGTDERIVPGLKMASEPDATIFLTERGNPDVLLPKAGTDPVRGRGTAGKGGSKKRMPSCNVTDSPYGAIRKDADVLLVIDRRRTVHDAGR